ncbi:hypothetical protein SRHO_G00035200 [Serrasalmus rhombeus]
MATECIKNCCRFFVTKEKEPDPQIIKAPVPGKAVKESGWKKNVGVSEDYLLSKLPPDGKEVPFVLPSFRPSYIQPRGAPYPNYQGSAWATYVDRKAELAAAGQIVYDPNVPVLPGHVISFVSPGSVRRPILRGNLGGGVSAWDQNGKQRLSASMLDLSSPHSHMQRFDSVSSVQSSTSSIQDSFGSSRSLGKSITLSGDERELGKVCVLLSYQEAVEQVWITVVQCKDLCVCAEGAEQPRVRIKGVITMARPVQFKTSVKDATPDMVFIETFVFSLNLEQLRSSALLLRLQTHTPRKRTLGECVLSLRTLGPQETQHWLDIRPPCKARRCPDGGEAPQVEGQPGESGVEEALQQCTEGGPSPGDKQRIKQPRFVMLSSNWLHASSRSAAGFSSRSSALRIYHHHPHSSHRVSL